MQKCKKNQKNVQNKHEKGKNKAKRLNDTYERSKPGNTSEQTVPTGAFTYRGWSIGGGGGGAAAAMYIYIYVYVYVYVYVYIYMYMYMYMYMYINIYLFMLGLLDHTRDIRSLEKRCPREVSASPEILQLDREPGAQNKPEV